MFSVSPDIPLKNKISITDGTIEGKSMKSGPLLNLKKKRNRSPSPKTWEDWQNLPLILIFVKLAISVFIKGGYYHHQLYCGEFSKTFSGEFNVRGRGILRFPYYQTMTRVTL